LEKLNTGVRWVGHYLRPYGGRLTALAALSIAEVLLRILTPWPLKAVVDHAIGQAPLPPSVSRLFAIVPGFGVGPREHMLIAIVCAGLVIQLVHQLVLMVHTRISAATGQRMVRDLQAEMFGHAQALSLSHHSKLPPADLLHRLDSDARCLEHLVLRGLFPIVFSAITLVAMFAVLMTIDPMLGLVSLVIVPLLFGWLRIYGVRMRPAADRAKTLESDVVQRLHETLRSIRLVKTYAREEMEQQRFGRVSGDALVAKIATARQESVFAVVVNLLTVGGTSLVVLIGGLSVLHGRISLGTLLLVLAYLGFVYGPLCGIANTTGALQQALASARRVRETLQLVPEMLDAPGSMNASAIRRGEVVFDNVSFAYESGRPVLDGVSFTARPGELIALVGPSGAGKSTAVQLITRLYEPTSGRIVIDDVDISRFSLRTLRQRVAIVMQDAIMIGGTVRDNLRYGRLDAKPAEIEAAARAAHAHEFIAKLPGGYDRDLGEAGSLLSGGQRQRLSIARAFLKNAPILVLDEPTSALDRISEELVFKGLAELQRGRTTFVIAHRLTTVENANRILVFDAGRIVAQGTHEELLASCELYGRLVDRLEQPAVELAAAV
jgi:ATP-binding cassette, subfamily B, bacterial